MACGVVFGGDEEGPHAAGLVGRLIGSVDWFGFFMRKGNMNSHARKRKLEEWAGRGDGGTPDMLSLRGEEDSNRYIDQFAAEGGSEEDFRDTPIGRDRRERA